MCSNSVDGSTTYVRRFLLFFADRLWPPTVVRFYPRGFVPTAIPIMRYVYADTRAAGVRGGWETEPQRAHWWVVPREGWGGYGATQLTGLCLPVKNETRAVNRKRKTTRRASQWESVGVSGSGKRGALAGTLFVFSMASNWFTFLCHLRSLNSPCYEPTGFAVR